MFQDGAASVLFGLQDGVGSVLCFIFLPNKNAKVHRQTIMEDWRCFFFGPAWPKKLFLVHFLSKKESVDAPWWAVQP